MPRITTPLTDTEVKKAKSKEKDYKLTDGQGLYILIKKNGNKFWRFYYKLNDKRNTISFGEYPMVSLKEARIKRKEAREKVSKGLNPNVKKFSDGNNTFQIISEKWFEIKKSDLKESTFKRIYAVVQNNCTDIMQKDMNSITRQDVLKLIDKMNSRGIFESIKRMMGQLYNIWKYAVTYEIVEHNIIADIDTKSIVKKKEVQHFAAITKEDDLKLLLEDIKEFRNNFRSDISTVIALEIAPFVALSKEQHPNGYGYTQFKKYYHKYRKKLNPSMRQIHLNGEKLFVDYSGVTVPIYDNKTGVVSEAQIFVAVLGASGYTYVDATPSQKQEYFIKSHTKAFNFFGGVPKILVPDNLKSAVIKNNKDGIVLNESYKALADYYGCVIEPARPYKPKDKFMISYVQS
jgi:hypothetical protein